MDDGTPISQETEDEETTGGMKYVHIGHVKSEVQVRYLVLVEEYSAIGLKS